MKLSEAFARKTYGPRKVEDRQLKKAKEEFMPRLEAFALAQLREIWLDLHDRDEVHKRYGDWVQDLINEGSFADVIEDFLDFRHEGKSIAKALEEDFN